MNFSTFIEKIFSNWQAKLLSLGLAVLLYAAFQIISLDTKVFSIPLEVRAGGNFVLTQNPPKFIRVEVKGLAEELGSIQESNITAYVDIAYAAESGKVMIPVQLELAENITLMEPFEVVLNPASVNVTLEENVVAWVPLEPIFAGTPADGYEVASWTASVEDVKISGPKSIVESTSVIYADGISLNDRTQSFSGEVNLISMNETVNVVEEEQATIFVEIIPQIVTVMFENVQPYSTTLPPTLAFAQPLPFLSIELSGEKNPLTAYAPADNTAELDVSQITEVGEYTIPITFNIPERFSLVSTSLTEVTFEIVEAPIIEDGLLDGSTETNEALLEEAL